jgi:hypothetical protein
MRQIETKHLESIRNQLRDKQGNLCAVCGRGFTRTDGPVVDHDHTTGVIRGVLHRSCNMAEGKIKVKANRGHKGVPAYDLLIGLGDYLRKHKTAQTGLIHPSHMTAEQKRIQRNNKAKIARDAKARLMAVKK